MFGDGLTPDVLVGFGSAYAAWCRLHSDHPVVVIGRDARTTGSICSDIVSGVLRASGCDVVDAGLATTPTVEMAVIKESATGGIILSASHNPANWNALKLLNGLGEFLSPEDGEWVIARVAEARDATVTYDKIGLYSADDYLDYHIQQICELPFIDPDKIAARRFKVAVDGVNSVGGIAVPALLVALGVRDKDITRINCEPTGVFTHNPEPLPDHLSGLMEAVVSTGCDVGFAVDPDADRLALVQDNGSFFGEELTQVLAADLMWSMRSGPFVTNLSSSRAIDDVAARFGEKVFRSAVGEINVVQKMKATGAQLGGEGNGGVILPDLHLGRDGLLGVAMTLQLLAERNTTLTALRASYPNYVMAKKKVDIAGVDPDHVLDAMKAAPTEGTMTDVDGVKIDFDDCWVHMRKSNTEPVIRVYAEAPTAEAADRLANQFIDMIKTV